MKVITALAILAFSNLSLANIYPDEDPCNPVPALEGEYQGEFDLRNDLDEARCNCEFPEPAPTEQADEYDERNRIDSQRCGGGPSPEFAIVPYFDPGPLPDLGPIIVPVPVGGWGPGVPDWRHRGGWHNPRWRSGGPPGRPGGRHFNRGTPRPRGPRGGGFWGSHGKPGGGGWKPSPPHREPPRPAPPHREPPRPAPRPVVPHRDLPRPSLGHLGRPGHP